jgi:DHA1 family bicyclomycin/chloramphenicol resistance-like MFS transporter
MTITSDQKTADASTAVEKSSRRHVLRFTLILGSLTAFAPFATDMYLSSFPTLAQYFATDLNKVQLSLSIFFFGLAAGQLIYGPLIDRFGRKPPLVAGIALFVASSILLVLADSIDSFVILRLLQAIGGCAGMIVSRAIINDLFEPRDGARILSLMMLVTGLGPIIAPIAGGYLLAFVGWQSIFVFLALFGACCFVASAFGLAESLPAEKRVRNGIPSALKTYARMVVQRDFIAPTLAGSFGFCGMFAFITASPSIFMDVHGVSQQAYGWLFGTNAVAMIIASQLNSILLRRFPMRRILFWALAFNVAMAGVLLAVSSTQSLIVLLVPIWLCLGTVPLIAANSTAIAMGASGENGGSASAIVGVFQFGFAAAVSAIISLLHDGTALPMAGTILAAGLLAMAAFLLGPSRPTEQKSKGE